jgi:glyoxylase-like metal-dependent hydrolase (beta-lactamase superfamily II)
VIEPTSPGQYAAWRERRRPPVERLRDGVWSIPVDCAAYPVRYTYAYAIAGRDGAFLLVDPGWDADAAVADLARGLDAAGLDPARLVGAVVTHYHPDHLAGAARLLAGTDAWLGLHPRDAGFFRTDSIPDREERWMRSCGIPEAAIAALPRSTDLALWHFPVERHRPLGDGDVLALDGRRLVVRATPGHTAGHICVVDEETGLVFTGDHVLPRTTPNVGADPREPCRDGVGEYLESLRALAPWSELEACPAHEYRFTGLGERLVELAQHQWLRGEEVARILAAMPDASAWDIASRLDWARDWGALDPPNRKAAVAEARSHLNHLRSLAPRPE